MAWLLSCVFTILAVSLAYARQPNIILILADDVGISTTSPMTYGGIYETPTLDSLAQQGILFRNSFSAPLCVPSRAQLLTGLYPFRTGVTMNGNGNGRLLTPNNSVIMARLLHDAGYATAIAGKWQLRYMKSQSEINAWGWDEAFVWKASELPDEPDGRYWQPRYRHNGELVPTQAGDYGPDLTHDFVVDFIRRHQNQPFFLYYPMVAVHDPFLPTPDSPPDSPDLYADNIRYMDKLIGQLVTELKRLGLLHQTLLLFTGDNGYARGSSGSDLVDGREISGGKNTLLEGGSRVPLVAYWQGVTPHGVVLDDLIDFSDFYPTLAAVAGIDLPADVNLDGRSFAPQLHGRPGWPRQWVYVQLDDNWYVRSAEWKLYKDGGLYDMWEAPYREIFTPVTGQSPDAAAARQRLQNVLNTLQEETGG